MTDRIIVNYNPITGEMSIPRTGTVITYVPASEINTAQTKRKPTHRVKYNHLYRPGSDVVKKPTTKKEEPKKIAVSEALESKKTIKRKPKHTRMRPMTPEGRHLDKKALRCCAAALDSTALRRLLLIEFSPNWYGYVSTVTDPYEDVLGLNLPAKKSPLQYRSKKTVHDHHTCKQIRADYRRAKPLMHGTPKEQLSLVDFYKLYVEEPIDTPIIDACLEAEEPAIKEQVLQAWRDAQKQAQQQRFADCMRSLYYPENVH